MIRIAPRSCATWRGAAGSCAPDGGIDKYQKSVWRVVVAGLDRVSARHPARSLRSTETTNDGKPRRGAATHLMGEVGDVFVAPRAVSVAGGGSPCGHHVGFGEGDLPPPSLAFPEHPAVSNATDFYCAPRIASLRSKRTKSPWHLKQPDARAFARRCNCALGTQPPNPRAHDHEGIQENAG